MQSTLSFAIQRFHDEKRHVSVPAVRNVLTPSLENGIGASRERAPEVSVVIIFLNAGPFLDGAIQSVLRQSFTDWELLLVDDGSFDGSSESAKAWAERHTGSIRYLEHPDHVNLGMSASRNLGIRHAKGHFVAFLDADDVWMPEKLTEQVALMRSRTDIAMTYGPALQWRPEVLEDHASSIQELELPLDAVVDPPKAISVFLEHPEGTPGPSGLMARRDILLKVGGGEASFRGMYEDQVLCCKIAAQFPIYVSSRVHYKYRLHTDSCCQVSLRNGTALGARRKFLLWLNQYLRRERIDDQQLKAAFRQEWARYFGWQAKAKAILRPMVPRAFLEFLGHGKRSAQR